MYDNKKTYYGNIKSFIKDISLKQFLPKRLMGNQVDISGSNSPGTGGFNQRGYDAGKMSRLMDDWNVDVADINIDIRNYKNKVDDRAYDLSKNNPYVKAYLVRSRANIIGDEGIKLQVRTRLPDNELDDFANILIERKFKEWGKKQNCTMSGRLSFVRLQWLLLDQLLLTGEFLIQIVRNVPLDENPFGISLQPLDPKDIDLTYNEDLGNGRIVLLGIEIDEWRRIKGIHLKQRSLTSELTQSAGYNYDRIFIPAEDLIFDMIMDHPKQVRGMTPLSASMVTLKGIDRWDNAALVNATATAKKMGFLIRKKQEGQPYVGSSRKSKDGTEEVDDDGGKYMDFEDGIVEELPYGYEFELMDPKYPHEQHGPYNKINLRKMAASFGQNYNSFASDYEGVTFSSLRQGVIDERDVWKVLQKLITESFGLPLYDEWLHWSLMAGALAPLSFANRERYTEHIWYPKRWDWVRPLEDVKAKKEAVKAGFISPVKVVNELGSDIEDIFKDLKRLKELEEKYDIKLDLFPDEETEIDDPDDESNTKIIRSIRLGAKGSRKIVYELGGNGYK